jgi:hypothetical protein
MARGIRVRNSCIALFVAFASASGAQQPDAVSRAPTPIVETTIQAHAIVGFEWIDLPLSRIVLVRGPRSGCALRFTSFRHGGNQQKPTIFRSGEESLYAEYDVVEFRGSEMKVQRLERRKVETHGMVGIGRLAFHRGNSEIRCGEHELTWLFPTGISPDELDISVALTGWSDFSAVRLDHTDLTWVTFDKAQTRPVIFIPIATLQPSN